jgi:hypothetical protein
MRPQSCDPCPFQGDRGVGARLWVYTLRPVLDMFRSLLVHAASAAVPVPPPNIISLPVVVCIVDGAFIPAESIVRWQ